MKTEYLEIIKKADNAALLIEFNKQSQIQGANAMFSNKWQRATEYVKVIQAELMERLGN